MLPERTRIPQSAGVDSPVRGQKAHAYLRLPSAVASQAIVLSKRPSFHTMIDLCTSQTSPPGWRSQAYEGYDV